jgi:DNA-binding GntR family transcriptional regulator
MWLHAGEHGVPAEILAEHEEIVDALEHRDTREALRLLAAHRSRSETFLTVLVDPANQPAGAGSPSRVVGQ